LAGVLKAGHTLTAPISVDGAWPLDTNNGTLFGQTLQNSVLTISQSGKNLVLHLNNGLETAGAGVLAGTTITATAPLPEMATGPCKSDQALALSAVLDSKAEPKTMLGTISFPGCSSCPEVSYRATRQSRSARKEAR